MEEGGRRSWLLRVLGMSMLPRIIKHVCRLRGDKVDCVGYFGDSPRVKGSRHKSKVLGLVTGESGSGCTLGWLDFVDTFLEHRE